MDLAVLVSSRHTKQFVFSRRTPKFRGLPQTVSNKCFDDLPAARDYWRTEAMKLIDQGLVCNDFQILGFHEED
jgi:hypothetical protein